jgi:hypothetical protein
MQVDLYCHVERNIISDERYPPEMPTLSASSPDTTQDQQHVSDGRDEGRDNDGIIMSDEHYPFEMPTFSASVLNMLQSQQQAPEGQDGGPDNDSIIMSDEHYPVEMPTFSASVLNMLRNQQQARGSQDEQALDSQDEGQNASEKPLRTFTITSPLLACHFGDQMQNPVPYHQQQHRVVGNPQTPGSKPFPKAILCQSIRDSASSNMMIRSFVQAMDNMAEGRV